jgi:hypothetical protein
MTVKKWLPGVFIFQVGLIVATISAIADHVGFGGPYIYFGPNQWIGVAVGLVIAIIGLRAALKKK